MSVDITGMLKQNMSLPVPKNCLVVVLSLSWCQSLYRKEGWQNQFSAADHLTLPWAAMLFTHGRHVGWFCWNICVHIFRFSADKGLKIDCSVSHSWQPKQRSIVTSNRKELRQYWGVSWTSSRLVKLIIELFTKKNMILSVTMIFCGVLKCVGSEWL